MYVQVYPIKRLPRRFKSFTYNLDASCAGGHEVSRGSFVLIPWRARVVRGVVSEIDVAKPEYDVKRVEAVLDERMSEDELNVYESEASDAFQSVSSLLDASFPNQRKRFLDARKSDSDSRAEARPLVKFSVKKTEIEDLKQSVSSAQASQFVQHDDILKTTILAKMLNEKYSKPILYILPHQHDVDVAADILQTWNEDFKICNSEFSESQRHDISKEWRQRKIKMLVTTRVGSTFLPPTNLGAVIVGRSGSPEHAQYDRNPRYDARSFALKWSTLNSSPIFFADTAPRCADFVRLKNISQNAGQSAKPVIVDLNSSAKLSGDVLISNELKNAISTVLELKGKILLVCNQKGVAGKLACKSCLFTELCKECKKPLSVYENHLFCSMCKRVTARPPLCRKCGGKNLKEVRRGIGALTQSIKNIWPNAKTSEIEKGSQEPTLESDIIIATSYYYETFYNPLRNRFGLVCLVSADQLTWQNAIEDSSRQILEYIGIAARHCAEIIIQTWNPDMMKKIISSSRELLAQECSSRQNLKQAPFVRELHLTQRGLSHGMLDALTDEIRTGSPKTMISHFGKEGVKLLTDDDFVIERLKNTDDRIVIKNKTYL